MNRIIGTLFALATLAAIAYAIYNAGSYSSMCFDREATLIEPIEDIAPVEEIAIESDSVEVVMELRDNLQQ